MSASIAALPRSTDSPTSPPRRRPDRAVRPRDYLREDEVERMIQAAERGRHPLRDQAVILLAFRHGLRSAELVDLQWSDIDWRHARLHVRRLKGSLDAVHPLSKREKKLLRDLQKEALQRAAKQGRPLGELVFETERSGELSRRLVRHIIAEAGRAAKIPFPVSAHMLRHSCGYHLSEQGADLRVIQAFLGHANVQNTQRYVALSSGRFNGVYWRD